MTRPARRPPYLQLERIAINRYRVAGSVPRDPDWRWAAPRGQDHSALCTRLRV